jgi:cytidylate kinase
VTSIEAIINRQLRKWELEQRQAQEKGEEHHEPEPIVTVSRQTGSRGSYFASRLATRLNYQRLHREVIDAIARTSGFRRRVVEALDEKHRNEIESLVDSVLTGQSVDYSDYIRYLCNVILSMSRLGGVIVMGRGSNFILGSDCGFHIRIVCPRDKRIENLMKYKMLEEKDAIREVDSSDVQRREFIQKLFDREIDDPLNYDLMINSALIDVEDMVDLVGMAIKAKMNKLRHLDHDSF